MTSGTSPVIMSWLAQSGVHHEPGGRGSTLNMSNKVAYKRTGVLKGCV